MDNLLSQHKGKVTTDDLCVLLTAEINNAAKHGQLSLLIIVHGNWGNVCVGGGGGGGQLYLNHHVTLPISLAGQFFWFCLDGIL